MTKLGRQFLSCEAQEGSKRDDGDEVEDKDGSGVPAHDARDDANGDEDEEDIDVVAGEGGIGEVHDMLGERLQARLALVVLSAPDERGRLVVETAIGGCRHVLLLAVGRRVTLMATEAVEVSLYVFCQARGLAEGFAAERGQMRAVVDGCGAAAGGVRLLPGTVERSTKSLLWWTGPGKGRKRENESKNHGYSLIAVGEESDGHERGCGWQYMICLYSQARRVESV